MHACPNGTWKLGQGCCNKGQSLESSFAHVRALEMGMLRVTVDQQQGRGNNAWMFPTATAAEPSIIAGLSQTVARGDEREQGESVVPDRTNG